MIIKDVDELTPIEKITDNFYLKRDDLFSPYNDIPINGGKVRQSIKLIEHNLNYIKSKCNNWVYTSGGILSPQSVILARVCKEYDINFKFFRGCTNKPKNNNLLDICEYLGGIIDTSTKNVYESNLNHTILECKNRGEKFFHIKFGINVETDRKSIIDSVSDQVKNIPNDINTIIVPCGSCIIISGIIEGCKKYNKNCEIIGIQIANYDRTDVIDSLIDNSIFNNISYKLLLSKDYNYRTPLNKRINDINLDKYYEAKAFDYYEKYLMNEFKNKKVLFWIVGNSTDVRNFSINKEFK